jgi:hypothetical protein
MKYLLAANLLVMILPCLSQPPSNTIPVIAMKAGQAEGLYDISIESLCLLNWCYFDGVWLEAWPYWDPMKKAMALCDSTGMWFVISDPWLGNLGDIWCGNAWSRYYPEPLSSDCAFIRTDTAGTVIVDSIDADSLHEEIIWRCNSIIGDEGDYESLWYCDTWNEAPAWQRSRMVSGLYDYDDYTPSLFTMDSSMSEVGTTSTWSWFQFIADSIEIGHPVATTASTMHRISNWAGYTTDGYDTAPTFHTLANSVRAYIGMEYQALSDPLPDPVENRPRLLGYNAYPFRQVGSVFETRYGESELGDSLHTWMLEHYEQGLDSVIVLASLQDHFPVHYHPQAFGICGGEELWLIGGSPLDTTILIGPYKYRLPSPAELRMLSNDALMRQARGVFPYSIRGYTEGEKQCAGILDEDLMPYDAPYEEWVYGERPTDDFYYAPPESFPPFREGFDPLFDLESRPTTSGARALQDYLEWKFAPYGRLWNSMRETLGEIAWMAPELSGLWWLDGTGHPGAVEIDWPDTCWAGPECRVFTGGEDDTLYIFYLNRCCRDSVHVFDIGFSHDDLPFPSGYALDHSRRFIIPREELDEDLFYFTDTLEAGQARLLQLIGSEAPADLRITRPDVTASTGPTAAGHDFGFTVADTVIIQATVYNMGTEGIEDVPVSLTDVTPDIHVLIGRDTLSFDGLSLDGYETDDATAEFRWVPSTPGVYRMQIEVTSVPEEPETQDNTTAALFLIEPRDYSTEVRGDAWDMTEATGIQPAWKTDDVEGEAGWAAFTDSIGGMLEGEIDEDSLQNNRLYLAIPAQSGRWIDAEVFDHLSLAVKLDRACDLYFGWETENDARGSCFVEELAAGWSRYAPIDLGGSVPDSLLKTAWLSFRPEQDDANLIVRIGWVKLTE